MNFLTPCIGIGTSGLIVIDSEHDVLLESSTIPLFENEFSCEFSYCAILVCWLTVNYQYFCSGLVEKYKTFKSNFFDIDKEKITVYEEKLQFQNVHSCYFPELKLKNSPPKKINYTPKVLETQKGIMEKILKWKKGPGSTNEEQ